MKIWGRFFRVQTLAADAMAPVLGAVLAIGIDWRLILVFVWGGLMHLVGFGMNNYFDRKYDVGHQHSNPISKGFIKADTAALVICIIWLAMWLMPVTFATGDSLIIYLAMIFMITTGTAYNMWSKQFVLIPGLLLGFWIFFETLCGYVFFSTTFDWKIVGLASIAFMQLWCQWIEGLLKDKAIDPRNLASVLKGWKWDGFFWSSKVVQVLAIDLLLWNLHPDALYGIGAFIFIILSVLLWAEIGAERERERLLRVSGAHEILVFGAVVFCLAPILGLWALAFLLIPALNYVLFNKLLFGAFGRPRI